MRQVDEHAEQASTGETVAHEQDRDADAEDRVEDDGPERDDRCHSERVQHRRVAQRVDHRTESVLERAPEDQNDREPDSIAR